MVILILILPDGLNLFSDEDDDLFWSNQAKPEFDASFELERYTSIFSLSQSTPTLSTSSLPSVSSMASTAIYISEGSITRNVGTNSKNNDYDDSEKLATNPNQKDSGYDSMPITNSEFINDFVPYTDPELFDVSSYESKLSQYDVETEAENFSKDPDSSELFRPNIDYYEAKLIQSKVMPDLKSFIRQSLQSELSKIKENGNYYTKALENNSGKVNSEQTTKRSASPDLFESEEEIEERITEMEDIIPLKLDELSPDVLKESIDDFYLMDQSLLRPVVGGAEEEFTRHLTSDRTLKLINRIQSIIEEFLKKIANDEPIELFIRNSNDASNCYLDSNDVLTMKQPSECNHKRVSSSHGRSRFRFKMIMFLLTEIHHFLMTGTTCTSRELYYKDPEFAKDPVNIHLGMKDVCCLLEAAPWELGVFSSSKGLIAGCLVMSLANGENVNCSLHSGGILLPHDTTGVQCLQSTAKYALLVEKDTVYEKLLRQNIFEKLGSDVILITGKGFPDVNTRVIVKKIASDLKIPIYGLFDADPFGIEIFFVYRHGSRGMSFNADKLACPQLKWIGVHPSEIELLGIPSMALSVEDKKKLKHLLDRPYISAEIKNELLVLQRGDRKAEIEGISSFSENYLLAEYIPNKIRRDFVM